MYTTREIKEAVNKYNGRKRLADIEIKHIRWFIRTKNLSLEEAVKAYFEDKEETKRLSYREYLARKKEICDEIKSHCANCRMNGCCIKNVLLETWSLDDAKTVQRSECWVNPM